MWNVFCLHFGLSIEHKSPSKDISQFQRQIQEHFISDQDEESVSVMR